MREPARAGLRFMASDLQKASTNPIAAFEPNVIIAGLEGAVVLWLLFPSLRPEFLGDDWQWAFAVYGVSPSSVSCSLASWWKALQALSNSL